MWKKLIPICGKAHISAYTRQIVALSVQNAHLSVEMRRAICATAQTVLLGPGVSEHMRAGAELLRRLGSPAHLSRVMAMTEWNCVRNAPMANQLPLGLIIHYNTNILMEALLN